VMDQMKADDPAFRMFVDSTGFDPRRDLQEVLMISNAVRAKDKGLVIARGVFNGPQLMQFVSKQDGGRSSVSSYKGVQLLTSPSGDNNALAVLDGSIALAGTAELVKAAIDRRAANTALDPRMLAKVAEVSGAYDIWAVTSSPALAAEMAGDKRLPADALKAIEQSSGGVKFGTMIRLGGEAVTRSDKDAEALADVFRFFSGMMKMNEKKPVNPMTSMLERVELKTIANLVQFSLSIPQAEVEQMLKNKTRAPLQ
jgi:hypothetical protein